jgi:hypothetical protein
MSKCGVGSYDKAAGPFFLSARWVRTFVSDISRNTEKRRAVLRSGFPIRSVRVVVTVTTSVFTCYTDMQSDPTPFRERIRHVYF